MRLTVLQCVRMFPFPPPPSHQRMYYPNRRQLDELLKVLVVGVTKGLNNPRHEFGLKLNTSNVGFITEFYQKPIQNSVGLYKMISRKKRKKKVTFSSGH